MMENIVADTEATTVDPMMFESYQPLAFIIEDVAFSTVLNGYAAPFFVGLTIVTNLLVCVVLMRPGMCTETNAVLVAIAFSDSMTGLAPLPCYIYFYTLGGQDDWVPFRWCFWYFCLTEYIPTVFHTASVWLTVLLAGQRYVCVSRGYMPRSQSSKRRLVIVKIIICIFMMAAVSQASRFVERDFFSVNATSLIDNSSMVAGCQYNYTHFVERHIQVYFNSVYWFRVVFIHLIPCSALVVLNVLLVGVLRTAQRRQRRLMVRPTAGSSVVVHQRPRLFRFGGSSNHASQCSIPPGTVVDPNSTPIHGNDVSRNGARRSSRNGSNTTLMLVTVVGMFLAVEVPLAVVLLVIIVQFTFEVNIIGQQEGAVASLVVNLVILISYPTNFFIYCAMSRAFRTTFKNIFCIRRRRRTGGPVATAGATAAGGGGGVSDAQGLSRRCRRLMSFGKQSADRADPREAEQHMPLTDLNPTGFVKPMPVIREKQPVLEGGHDVTAI